MSLQFVKNLEPKYKPPTRINKVVIEDYYYLTIMDENVNWMELTHLLSIFSQNHRAPFCTSTFTPTFLITFLWQQWCLYDNKVHSNKGLVYNTPK